MHVVVFGAAGGVGSEAVRLGAERGHTVTAAARRVEGLPGAPGVRPLAVDVRDAAAVALALQGADAVLWCVGVTGSSGGDVGRASLPGVLAAMRTSGTSRIVTVSGAGVTVPGDRKGAGARFVSALTRRFAKDLVEDKAGEHDLLAASDAVWTEVRPPRLVQRAGTGRYELGEQAPGLTAKPVTKADVALALLTLAGGTDWSRRSPFITAAAA